MSMETMEPIYLDHCATTPIAPEVMSSMMGYFGFKFGNASSSHQMGSEAQDAVIVARKKIAQTIGATSDEIIFTSGGTEADNLAILGCANATPKDKNHIITS
ncbi:MAG: aminotransferase class V-fold PLP-dependent enzyme, partial [Deltaproteobacteria bacterium]